MKIIIEVDTDKKRVTINPKLNEFQVLKLYHYLTATTNTLKEHITTKEVQNKIINTTDGLKELRKRINKKLKEVVE